MIDLRHFRYFIAAAEEVNFRRTAERVHIDQTPLSRTVRDLDEQLGVLLFVRGPRKLGPTPAGARLLKEARHLFVRRERTRRVVVATDARYRVPLRIGVAIVNDRNRYRPPSQVEFVEIRDLRVPLSLSFVFAEDGSNPALEPMLGHLRAASAKQGSARGARRQP